MKYTPKQVQVMSFSAKKKERAVAAGAVMADEAIVVRLAADDSDLVRAEVARRSDIPESIVEGLAADVVPAVRLSLALNKMIVVHDETLLRLAKDNYYKVRSAVAARSDVTAEVCELLKKDFDFSVRRVLAANQVTSPEVLVSLSRDRVATMKSKVAGNPNTPAELLAKFSSSRDSNVLEALAGNRSTPMNALPKVLRSVSLSGKTLCAVVEREDVTLEVLEAVRCITGLKKPVRDAVVVRLAAVDPQFEGYPWEWVEAQVFG